MKTMLEDAAKRFGVPSEVLDLIGRNFICQVIEDFPGLLLPPIMETLKKEYVKNGLDWVKENVKSLQDQFLLLKKYYGPHWLLA